MEKDREKLKISKIKTASGSCNSEIDKSCNEIIIDMEKSKWELDEIKPHFEFFERGETDAHVMMLFKKEMK